MAEKAKFIAKMYGLTVFSFKPLFFYNTVGLPFSIRISMETSALVEALSIGKCICFFPRLKIPILKTFSKTALVFSFSRYLNSIFFVFKGLRFSNER